VTAAWTLSLEITFYCWMGILFAANQLKHVRWYIAAWLLVQVLVDELAGARPVWGDILKTLFIFQYAHMFSMGLCLYLLSRRSAQPPSPPALIDNGETQPLLVQEGDQKRPAGQDNNPIQEQQPQQQQQQRGQDLARAILPELKVIWPEVALLIAIFCIAMWVKSPWGDVVRAYPTIARSTRCSASSPRGDGHLRLLLRILRWRYRGRRGPAPWLRDLPNPP